MTASSSTNIPNRRTYACIRCYDRKVKCDAEKQHPCSACVKHNVECVLRSQPTASRKTRRRTIGGGIGNQAKLDGQTSPQQAVQNEAVATITDSGCTPSFQPSGLAKKDASLQLLTPVSTASEPERSLTRTQLVCVPGRSKFVNNSLWTRVVEEVHDAEEALEDDSYDNSDAEISENNLDYALGPSPETVRRHSHPANEYMLELWQIFTENVEPVTKIVHVPTLGIAVQKAITDVTKVPKSFEALLFAIYSTAIVSLTDDECKRRFGKPRETLLSRYISATKAALSRANFIGTVSLIVLQAFVLHLISVRDVYDPRTLWVLNGIAIRNAESMGLHRDGEELGLSPFESEIRRRIWWHLKMHDFRTAELSGLPKFRGVQTLVNASKPKHVNDSDLYPGMSSPPTERSGVTDMIFCVSRSDYFNFGLKNISSANTANAECLWEESVSTRTLAKSGFIEKAESMIESRYLRYCDPSQPLELMTMLCCRAALNVGRFIAHHPRGWANERDVPEEERQLVWNTCIKLLEQYDVMQSSRQLQRYAWSIPYYIQWHAIIHLLDTLRAQPLGGEADRAWQLIQTTYENNPQLTSNTRKALYVAVGNLCLKAYNAREAALMNGGKSIPTAPQYITMLRQQRLAAKVRRETKAARGKKNDVVTLKEQPKIPTAEFTTMAMFPSDVSNQGNISTQQQFPSQTTFDDFYSPSNVETPWFSNQFDSMLGTSANMMDIDPDFMLAQDQNLGPSPGQPIDWTQWDAWVSNLNMARGSYGPGAFNDFEQLSF